MFETFILHHPQPSGLGLLIEFFICAIIVIFSGSRLSRYGDVIGDRTGMGNVWVGIILLSLITSLPELVASVGSVIVVKEPDLAMGNLFGSNLFNLMILVVLDFVSGKETIMSRIKKGQILVAAQGMAFMGIAAFSMTLVQVARPLGMSMSVFASLLIALAYANGVRQISLNERNAYSEEPEETVNNVLRGISLRQATVFFSLNAVIILVAGLWLVKLGDILAEYHFSIGSRYIVLGESFVGTIFLALVTSFPELIVSLSALRIGALSMAAGNVLGSNLCNMTLIPVMDIYFFPRMKYSILAAGSPQHILTAILAIIITGIVVSSLAFRSRRSFLRLGVDSWIMLVLYLLGIYILFCVR